MWQGGVGDAGNVDTSQVAQADVTGGGLAHGDPKPKRLDMCKDMCIDMCMGIRIGMRIGMRMCIRMCMDMCTDMCVDMCTDMTIWARAQIWPNVTGSSHTQASHGLHSYGIYSYGIYVTASSHADC